jgi:hypothetical protein
LAVSTLGLNASHEPLRWAGADRSGATSHPLVLRSVSWQLPGARCPEDVQVSIGAATLFATRDQIGPFAVGLRWKPVVIGMTLAFDDGRRQVRLRAPEGRIKDDTVQLDGGVHATAWEVTSWSAGQVRWRFGEDRLLVHGAAVSSSPTRSVRSAGWDETTLWLESVAEAAGDHTNSERESR